MLFTKFRQQTYNNGNNPFYIQVVWAPLYIVTLAMLQRLINCRYIIIITATIIIIYYYYYFTHHIHNHFKKISTLHKLRSEHAMRSVNIVFFNRRF